MEKIKKVGEKIIAIPNNFNAHPTIRKIFENKKKMFITGKGFVVVGDGREWEPTTKATAQAPTKCNRNAMK